MTVSNMPAVVVVACTGALAAAILGSGALVAVWLGFASLVLVLKEGKRP